MGSLWLVHARGKARVDCRVGETAQEREAPAVSWAQLCIGSISLCLVAAGSLVDADRKRGVPTP